MTLVEVMIGAALFTLIATGLTAGYIQNLRMAKNISYRTQAANTAMSILEQFRANGYFDLLERYYKPASPPPLTVKVLDPTQTSTIPTGYRDLDLPINRRDSELLSGDWTPLNLTISDTGESTKLPMRFWVYLQERSEPTGKVFAVFELALFYQWRNPTDPADKWQSGTFRMVVPKLTVGTDDI